MPDGHCHAGLDHPPPRRACSTRSWACRRTVPLFDLSAGCTGFLYAMETAAAMLPRMARPCALLVGGELLSRITDSG